MNQAPEVSKPTGVHVNTNLGLDRDKDLLGNTLPPTSPAPDVMKQTAASYHAQVEKTDTMQRRQDATDFRQKLAEDQNEMQKLHDSLLV